MSVPIPPEALALLTGEATEEATPVETPVEAQTEEKPTSEEVVAKEEAPAEPKEEKEEEEAEKPVEAKEEETEDATGWNKRFSALARKEREVMRIQKEATELKKQVEAQRAQFEEGMKYKQVFNEAVDMFKVNPRAFIKDLCEYTGMNENTFYSNYTKQVLNDGQQPPDLMFNSLKEEIQSLKNELLNKEKSNLQQMQEEKISRFKDSIKEHVFRGEYPLIKQYGATNEVFEFIEQDFRAKGSDPSKALTIEEACREFERALKYYSQVDEERTAPQQTTQGKSKKAMSSTLSTKAAPEAMSAPKEETYEQRKQRLAREAGLLN